MADSDPDRTMSLTLLPTSSTISVADEVGSSPTPEPQHRSRGRVHSASSASYPATTLLRKPYLMSFDMTTAAVAAADTSHDYDSQRERSITTCPLGVLVPVADSYSVGCDENVIVELEHSPPTQCRRCSVIKQLFSPRCCFQQDSRGRQTTYFSALPGFPQKSTSVLCVRGQ